MVFLQAATGASTGPAASCLRAAEEGKAKLLLSPAVLTELTDILSRPTLRKKFKNLADKMAMNFLGQVLSCAESLPEPPTAFPIRRDPDDEPYLNLAIAGSAEYLVTWDKDLLSLMEKDTPEGKNFCARYPNLKILTPPKFLEEVRRKRAAEGKGAGGDVHG